MGKAYECDNCKQLFLGSAPRVVSKTEGLNYYYVDNTNNYRVIVQVDFSKELCKPCYNKIVIEALNTAIKKLGE